jgi:hypothetical protein
MKVIDPMTTIFPVVPGSVRPLIVSGILEGFLC